MKIENIEVTGFRHSLRNMRNPKESWPQADSVFDWSLSAEGPYFASREGDQHCISCPEMPRIGPKDLKLARKLVKAGGDHRKFMRTIHVQWDISIPRKIWQELDTFKVATVRNSCSTMHKLGHRDLTVADFQDGDVGRAVLEEQNAMGVCYRTKVVYADTEASKAYKGVELLDHMKNRLPEAFLQRAGFDFNYETALKMYWSRRNHKLKEWSGSAGICATLLRLPYFPELASALGDIA